MGIAGSVGPVRAQAAGTALRSLLDLALPLSCASCQAPDHRICPACRLAVADCLWAGGPRAVAPRPAPAGLPEVISAGRYEGPVARLVSAYKDAGRRDCAAVLGGLLASSLEASLGRHATTAHLLRRGDGPVLVVPVPSSRAARRRRGDAPMADLARRACDEFSPTELLPAPALAPRRRVADQAGLTAAQRAANLEASMQVRRSWEQIVDGAVCVVVDDVLTTGATLVEAARALREAGAREVTAATICATQRRAARR
ncbi:ComF family protein [Nostocoides sp. HKS02]|nr:ComF family protein [Tetrasphaera sp. HKS02]